jgi:hypothetical protein
MKNKLKLIELSLKEQNTVVGGQTSLEGEAKAKESSLLHKEAHHKTYAVVIRGELVQKH